MSLYKRRETVVEAICLNDNLSIDEALLWIKERGGNGWVKGRDPSLIIVDTKDDNTIARFGYYIIFEDYEFYVMRPNKFHKLYEPLD